MLFEDDSGQLFEGLIKIIEEWKPKTYSDETQYKQALYVYLKNLQEIGKINEKRTIRTEAGESRADLRVSDVGIELKKKLDTKSHRDRAENQIRLMLKEFNYLIVVIVGNNHNREAIDIFKHHLNDFINEGDLLMGNRKKIEVIEVGKNKSKKRSKELNNQIGLNTKMFDFSSLN